MNRNLNVLPKIDAHMHIWDVSKNNNPWLSDEGKIAFRYGDYSAIRCNYLLSDYRKDFASHHICGTVFVETQWNKWGIEDEIEFVEQHNDDNFIKAVICQAWLEYDFKKQLEIIKRHPLVKGIRQKPRLVEREQYKTGQVYSGTMLHPDFMQGLAILAENNLIFEVQTAWWHLCELHKVKEQLPELKIVINHAGMPEKRDVETISRWTAALADIADLDDIYIKVSGFGEKNLWSFDRNEVIFTILLALFPIERLLFATNFPVDKVVVAADELMEGFYRGLSTLNTLDVEKIFFKNAFDLYRIKGA